MSRSSQLEYYYANRERILKRMAEARGGRVRKDLFRDNLFDDGKLRECKKCNKRLGYSHFRPNRPHPNRKHWICKTCEFLQERDRHRRYSKEHREEENRKRRARYNKTKEQQRKYRWRLKNLERYQETRKRWDKKRNHKEVQELSDHYVRYVMKRNGVPGDIVLSKELLEKKRKHLLIFRKIKEVRRKLDGKS